MVGGYLVIALPTRAIEVDRLHRALCESQAWRDFLSPVGAAEFARLMSLGEGESQDIEDNDRFESDAVSGYSGGDYPPWWVVEMERCVPTEIIERFGLRESSVVNGSFYRIDPSRKREVAEAVEAAGNVVVERTDLKFW
jgi:hypothetical protein